MNRENLNFLFMLKYKKKEDFTKHLVLNDAWSTFELLKS